jgi:hypothetical protein
MSCSDPIEPRAIRGGFAGHFRHRLARVLRDSGGNVAIIVGLGMPAIVGASGVTMDVATWYHAKKEAQVAADSAAYAAALNIAEQGLSNTASQPQLEVRANDAAGRNGYTGTITVNYPPTSGVATGDTRAVEVILTEPAPLYFSGVFWNGTPNIQARAVAMAVVSEACIWALDPSERATMSVVGGAQVDLGCGVVVNSDHPDAALDQSGTSCLNATSIAVNGGSDGSCVNPQAEKYLADYGDPMSGVPFPTDADIGSCDHTTKYTVSSGDVTFYPGTYCGDISVSGGNVTFASGIYYMDGADIKVSSTSTVTSEAGGVTFFLTGVSNDFTQVDIAAGAVVSLKARTVDPYANILFYQDPAAPWNSKNKFTGEATMELEGILYFPNTSVEFAGGSSGTESRVAIVADELVFAGNTTIDGSYAASLLPQRNFARLVE